MSYLPAEQTGYFEAVQVFFTEITDRMVMFGARDRQLLEQWKDEGRPVRLICRGIKEAVASSDEGDPPRSIAACESCVDEEWEAIRQRTVGTHGADEHAGDTTPDSNGASPTLFDRVEQAMGEAEERLEENRWKEAYLRAWSSMKESIEHPETFEFSQLDELDDALVAAWLDALDDDELRRIERAIDRRAKGLVDAMSPEAKRRQLQELKKRELIDRYGLVDLFDLV